MKDNKILRFTINIILVILLLTSVVFLNIIIQNTTQSNNEKKVKTSQQSRLNVALVNEDQPVKVGKKEYGLGLSYIKNIERDDSQNWAVTTRGGAEQGLKDGKYQLMVTIPSDFSSKVLDINSINVDKTMVTYKVNANGNSQVENDANKLAKDIIADLNQQLVDMYMASILSNLYTAQKNVEASSKVQNANIDDYKNNLLGSALTVKDLFPGLVNLTNNSITANQSLKSSLESSSTIFDSLDTTDTGASDYNTTLEQRSQNQISEQEQRVNLISMNPQELSQGNQTAYQQLLEAQANLTNKLNSSAQNQQNSDVNQQAQEERLGTTKGIADELNKEIADLKKSQGDAAKTQEELEKLVERRLGDYFNVDISKGEKITLSMLLNKAGKANANQADQANQDNQANLKTVSSQLDAQLKQSIEALPSLNSAELASNLNKLGNASSKITALDSSFIINHFGNGIAINTSAKTELENLAVAVENSLQGQANQNGAVGTTAQVSIAVPDGLTLNSWTFGNQTFTDAGTHEVTLGENNSFSVNVTPVTTPVSPDANNNAADGNGDNQNQTPAATPSEITLMINGVKSGTISVDNQTIADYASKVQEIVSNYNHAQALIDAYYPITNGERTSIVQTNNAAGEDTDLTAVLKDLVMSSTGTVGDLTSLENLSNKLTANVDELNQANINLAEQISQQLTAYDNLSQANSNLTDTHAKTVEDYAKTSSDLSNLNSKYQSLLSAATDLRSNSIQNASAADSVGSLYSSFNSELEYAKNNTEKVSTTAESLMSKFNQELADNGEFVASFVKVLNNAYENGVPNDVLLDFLSNPVGQNSSSVKATVNVYRPFTWILLLEVVALFTAYLFATQNVIRRVKDKFKLDKLHATDIVTVGVLSGLSLVIGLAIGIFSGSQLNIGREYIPSWNMLMIFASFVLVQGQYLLLKHLRAIGMGIILFMIISFVYLSNAIGTTVSVKGFPAFVKSINILSILEGTLSGYFDGQSAGFFMFFFLFLAIVALTVANIFIKRFTFTEKEV